IIDPAEAMTTIDVNTGAFVGHRNLEETIFKTNLEAAMAIARQLRLRNLGGIIIIDFIDMEDEEHRRQVLRTLEKQVERDHAKTNIIGITELGLVQMTRKRTRESLEQVLCEPCASCQGRGKLKTAETICYEIFREILREARAFQAEGHLVLANQKVVERLLDEESGNVADGEAFIGRTIRFQAESEFSQEQYDVVLLCRDRSAAPDQRPVAPVPDPAGGGPGARRPVCEPGPRAGAAVRRLPRVAGAARRRDPGHAAAHRSPRRAHERLSARAGGPRH